MTLDDLARHETDFVEPIKYTYADEVTVYEVSNLSYGFLGAHPSSVSTKWPGFVCRPAFALRLTTSPGITALIALGILEHIQRLELAKPLLSMEHNSAEYLHTLVEAMRFVPLLWPCHRFSLLEQPRFCWSAFANACVFPVI